MALKSVLTAEEFEGLDEGLREHYTATADGKYYLDAEGVDELPTVRGLANTLRKYREAAPDANSLKRKLEEAQALREAIGDLDAEGVRAALERLEQLESGAQDKDHQAEIQRVKDTLLKQHQKAIEEKDAEIARLTAHVESREIDQAIDAGLDKIGVIPQARAAVKAYLKTKGPRVLWEDGSPRGVFAGELGEEIPIATYVEAWGRTDEAKAFLPASGNQGSGAKNGTGGNMAGSVNPWKQESWNVTEQSRIIRDNPQLAQQLAMQAGRKLQLA